MRLDQAKQIDPICPTCGAKMLAVESPRGFSEIDYMDETGYYEIGTLVYSHFAEKPDWFECRGRAVHKFQFVNGGFVPLPQEEHEPIHEHMPYWAWTLVLQSSMHEAAAAVATGIEDPTKRAAWCNLWDVDKSDNKEE